MIDLRSDTVTTPSDAMREAARDADVGDDVYGEDPTVNELESRAADLLGMDDALYVPSGTMGNQVAARTHTERGQEIVLEADSHIYNWEVGGLAQHAQLQVRPVVGDDDGAIEPDAIDDAVATETDHKPGTGLVALENTHNARGGTAIDPARIDAAARAAHDQDVPVHLDGARLFNAATALDVPAERLTRTVDSVQFCLSKGLGAPVGSVIAGSASFIEAAHRNRKLLGGGMRQAGIIAAPGLLALENRHRLAEDHRRAQRLAAGLDAIPGLRVQSPDTNIVLVETPGAADQFLEACEREGVLGVAFGEGVVRFTTHWDVEDAAIESAIAGVEAAVDAL
jgi:threonine aldolase